MIRLLLVFILLFSVVEGQYTFTEEEIIKMQTKTQKLIESDSLKTVALEQSSAIIMNLEHQAEIDSLLLDYKDEHLGILEDRIELYKKELERVKPKWYESPEIYRLQGALIILISAYVVSLVN